MDSLGSTLPRFTLSFDTGTGVVDRTGDAESTGETRQTPWFTPEWGPGTTPLASRGGVGRYLSRVGVPGFLPQEFDGTVSCLTRVTPLSSSLHPGTPEPFFPTTTSLVPPVSDLLISWGHRGVGTELRVPGLVSKGGRTYTLSDPSNTCPVYGSGWGLDLSHYTGSLAPGPEGQEVSSRSPRLFLSPDFGKRSVIDTEKGRHAHGTLGMANTWKTVV